MTNETVFTNARVVKRDEIVEGSVKVTDGRIAAIDSGNVAGGLDLEGDFLVPGLIEMHTDNLEKHLVPRPGVLWPTPLSSILAHDMQIIGSGITTVFDAISVGEFQENSMRRHILGLAIEAIRQARRHELLRADHHVHMRCELADPAMVEIFSPFTHDPLVQLVSLMDHTPGQRQWRDMEQMRTFQRRENWSEEKIQAFVDDRRAKQAKYANTHRREVLKRLNGRAIPLASHDDTTAEHVEEAVGDGIGISEFPTTVEAARAARTRGMSIIMGAPNVVRGGSHSGNVSALDLASEGLLDGLSSDYAPKSLLHAAFVLHDRIGLGLPQAIATVSANVADAVGFNDRGEVAPDKRADLVRVRQIGEVPVVRSVWRDGQQTI